MMVTAKPCCASSYATAKPANPAPAISTRFGAGLADGVVAKLNGLKSKPVDAAKKFLRSSFISSSSCPDKLKLCCQPAYA